MAGRKTLKKLLCLATVLAMLLSLSACGIGSAFSAAKTARAMTKIESFRGEALVELELSAYTLTVPATVKAPVECIVSPFVASVDSELVTDGNSFPLLRMYAEKDGSNLNLYLGSNTASILGGKTRWVAQQITLGDVKDIKLDTKTIMAAFMALAGSFEPGGEETVGKFKTQRYDGALPRNLVSKFFEDVGTVSFLGASFTAEDLINAVTGTAISFWVDTDAHRIVKLEVDLSSFASKMSLDAVKQIIGNIDASVEKAVLSFTVEDFNCVNEIIIPPEAREALK